MNNCQILRCIFAFFLSLPLHAEGRILACDQVVAETERDPRICQVSDDECATTILRLVSGPQLFRMSFSGGYALDNLGSGFFETAIAHSESPVIDGSFGHLAFALFQKDLGMRVRFELLDMRALFQYAFEDKPNFLPNAGDDELGTRDDKWRPFLGEFFGLGGSLFGVQYDTLTGRVITEWIRISSVVNLLGTGKRVAYLYRHLNLSIGADLRTIQNIQPVPERTNESFALPITLRAMMRSSDTRLEGKADLHFRPVAYGSKGVFQEFQIMGEGRFGYNFLASEFIPLNLGLIVRASYYSEPKNSFDISASAEKNWNLYSGVVVTAALGR